ncbi:MAG: hypothetical protein P1P87_00845 [Trueperaceae bacterium]|nr:hypothetical protein [Trueperaceae bacterium]
MPRLNAITGTAFSDAGPLPHVVHVGPGLASLVLCLRAGQLLDAPAEDTTETVFAVLSGRGRVVEGARTHEVVAGDVVHVLPGSGKGLRALDDLVVLGVRSLARPAA